MTIMLIIILTFLSVFVGMVFGYALLSWSLRQDGYYLKYDRSKEVGKGRYEILQELDIDFGSEDE